MRVSTTYKYIHIYITLVLVCWVTVLCECICNRSRYNQYPHICFSASFHTLFFFSLSSCMACSWYIKHLLFALSLSPNYFNSIVYNNFLPGASSFLIIYLYFHYLIMCYFYHLQGAIATSYFLYFIMMCKIYHLI